MPRAVFSRRQEGLDGETVARLAAVHGTRPNPAGPANAGGQDWTLLRRSSWRLVSVRQSFLGPRGRSSSGSRGGLGFGACSSSSHGGEGGGGLSQVTDCLDEWWNSDPAQRPAAADAAERLEAAAASAAEEDTEAAGRSCTSLLLPAPLHSSSSQQPSPPSRGRRGAGGLLVCWGRAGPGREPEEESDRALTKPALKKIVRQEVENGQE